MVLKRILLLLLLLLTIISDCVQICCRSKGDWHVRLFRVNFQGALSHVHYTIFGPDVLS